MLWIFFTIFFLLWLLGLFTAYTFGGFIHALLVIAVAVLLVKLMDRRPAV